MRIVMTVAMVALVSCGFTLTGCASKVNKADLVGSYLMRTSKGRDCVSLYKNGSYVHVFMAKEGINYKQSGLWSLENLQAGQTVVLDGFKKLYGRRSKMSEFYLLLVSNEWGSVNLILNVDTGVGYTRIRSRCQGERQE